MNKTKDLCMATAKIGNKLYTGVIIGMRLQNDFSTGGRRYYYNILHNNGIVLCTDKEIIKKSRKSID